MKISLLITTYNRPDALEAVLVSIEQQVLKPDQVVIADDGSDDRTSQVIRRYQEKWDIPLVHAWQEDKGFRLAESRNRGLALVTGDYVVMIDGDIILHNHFILDHCKNAKVGYFLQGTRNLLQPELTRKILANPTRPYKIKYLERGSESRLEKALFAFRSPRLTRLLKKELGHDLRAIRTCNISFFYTDILEVNGFNNKIVGWGREDSEFVERLFNKGVKRYNIKFSALTYHLYHKEASRSSLPENDRLLQYTIDNKLVSIEDGLSKFLEG